MIRFLLSLLFFSALASSRGAFAQQTPGFYNSTPLLEGEQESIDTIVLNQTGLAAVSRPDASLFFDQQGQATLLPDCDNCFYLSIAGRTNTHVFGFAHVGKPNNYARRAFISDLTSTTLLPFTVESHITAVSETGAVAGTLWNYVGTGKNRAFRWSQSAGLEVIPVPQGVNSNFAECRATAINNIGETVIRCVDNNSNVVLAVWSGQFRILPLPAGISPLSASANTISNLGVVGGSSRTSPNDTTVRAVTWNTAGQMQPLTGLPNADLCSVTSINSSGLMVGECRVNWNLRPVIFVQSTGFDLNALLNSPVDYTLWRATQITDAGKIAVRTRWIRAGQMYMGAAILSP